MNSVPPSDWETGPASMFVRPGHVLEGVVDTSATETRTAGAVYIDRLVAAPQGQVWFADGRGDLWGLPDTASVATRFVPEQGREQQLRRSLIPYRLPGRRRLYLEEELSPAVDNAVIGLVARGVVVRARYRGLLRSEHNILGGPRRYSPALAFIRDVSPDDEAWSVRFMRRFDECVAANISTLAGQGLGLSRVEVETETSGSGSGIRRWLDLSALSAQPPADLDELGWWLLSAEPGSDRFGTDDPLLDSAGRPALIISVPDTMTSPRPHRATTIAAATPESPESAVREPIPKAHIDVLIAAGLYFLPWTSLDLVGTGRALQRDADVGVTTGADAIAYTVTHVSDLEPAAMIAAVASYLDRLAPGAATAPARGWCTGLLEHAQSHSVLWHEDAAEIIHATPQVIDSLDDVPQRIGVDGLDARVHYDNSRTGRTITLVVNAPTTAAGVQQAAAEIDWRHDNRWWDRRDTITAIVNDTVTATGTPTHVRTALHNLRDHHNTHHPAQVGDTVSCAHRPGHWVVDNITASGRATLRSVPGTSIGYDDSYLRPGKPVPLREVAVLHPGTAHETSSATGGLGVGADIAALTAACDARPQPHPDNPADAEPAPAPAAAAEAAADAGVAAGP